MPNIFITLMFKVTMSAGHSWPDNITRQWDIPGLSYHDMFISQCSTPWPDTNIVQMVVHNNKMLLSKSSYSNLCLYFRY